jgi:hypothetical protein
MMEGPGADSEEKHEPVSDIDTAVVVVGLKALDPEWPIREAIDRAARLAAIPAGESPANRRSPVAVVVISSNGEGDRSVESLEVKVPEGWAFQSDPYRGASNLAGCSGSEPVKPRNLPPARNGLRECRECRAGGHSAKANVGIEYLDIDVELPGVGEDGMPGRNEQ